jgi:antitoxin (DNA-binding transcriptional repressor) of toxin-antitoxin stability system
MKRFLVREARAAFTDLLDAAERGEPVVIERRGVLFRLAAEPPPRRRRRTPRIARVHDQVARGQWTWDWSADGLTLRDASDS